MLVTKYRRKCLNKIILKRLETLCWDIDILEFGGESDHIHLLLNMHPNIMPSKFINSLKTVTSRLLRKEFPEHMDKYYWKPVLWTRAYCLISAGSAPLSTLKEYIQNQGKK